MAKFGKKILPFLKKRWKVFLVLIVLVLSGIFIVSAKNKKNVKTTTVQKGKISEELILSGTVTATNYTKLYFETGGKIVYVGVKEGDQVKKGKLLSKLDTTLLSSTYQQALSDLRYYDSHVENVHDQAKGHDNDESYAQKDTRTYSESLKDKAYESVIKAKRNLDGASLYAPFDGTITYLAYPFSGANILATVPQVEIIDPTTIYLQVLADQTEVTKLYVGQKVNIILDSFEDKEFEGVVKNISFTPVSGESGSSYAVKVEFVGIDLADSRFKIGMTGDAKFITNQKDDVLYVDSTFISSDKEGKYVETNPGSGKVYIEEGLESEETTEIISDEISEGQTLYK